MLMFCHVLQLLGANFEPKWKWYPPRLVYKSATSPKVLSYGGVAQRLVNGVQTRYCVSSSLCVALRNICDDYYGEEQFIFCPSIAI